jgi:hypothetical protein
MRRGASAWQYKTVCDLLPGAYHLGFIAHTELDFWVEKLDGKKDCVVIKSHAFLPDYNMTNIKLEKMGILTTIRDLRDVAVSMKRMWDVWMWGTLNAGEKTNLSINIAAIIKENDLWRHYAYDNNVPILCQRYECVVKSYSESTRNIFAFLLSLGLSPLNEPDRVAVENSPENMKNLYIQYGESNRVWYHHKHTGDGRVGKWRDELGNRNLRSVMSVGKTWMDENGYK